MSRSVMARSGWPDPTWEWRHAAVPVPGDDRCCRNHHRGGCPLPRRVPGPRRGGAAPGAGGRRGPAAGGCAGPGAGPVLPGSRTAAGPTLSVSSQLDTRRYAASGDRAYELGAGDGRYPAMGFHTRGEMGGIWTPPVKLLDGIWFGVNGQWIGPATTFTSGFRYRHLAP